jgi:S1-C subfamily serine protease
MKAIRWCLAGIILLLVSANICAEIYRYQDANGKWQYTDKAPADSMKAEIVKLKGSETEKTPEDSTGDDLASYLTQKINPVSDIEKATLAVVKVETSYGSGSGFFVTDKGFLITNKHVVRPGSFAQFENELKQAEERLHQSEAYLAARGTDLDRYKRQIDDYKQKIDAAGDDYKAKMQEEYSYQLTRYEDAETEYQKAEKQLDAARQDMDMRKSRMGESSVASTFKIIFKDGTTKQAMLVALGKDHDLALLKIVGGFKTPFLEQGQRESFPQGSEVYAIGSPLGFQDFVTKGNITRQEANQIVTDTKILPGNSGGPLVTPAGKVIGVNTMVFRSNGAPGSEVFGFAIPIDAVKAEFSSRW